MKILIKMEAILYIFFLILFIYSFEEKQIATMTILAAIIHECGHLFLLCLISNVKFSLPKGHISGFRITVANSLSYKNELLVLLGGPLANLLFFLLFFSLDGPLASFAAINFLTMLSNMLPIEKYDGYKILDCILSVKFRSYARAAIILSNISFAFCCITCFFSLYLILKLGTGYWIFTILTYNIIKSISKR